MKKLASKALKEAKELPKPFWVAALVIPFGIEILAVYIAIRSVLKNKLD